MCVSMFLLVLLVAAFLTHNEVILVVAKNECSIDFFLFRENVIHVYATGRVSTVILNQHVAIPVNSSKKNCILAIFKRKTNL